MTRRDVMRGSAAAAFVPGPRAGELRGEPKICLWADNTEVATLRRIKQLGVDHACMGGPRIPWEEARINELRQTFPAAGLTLANIIIGLTPAILYGRPGRGLRRSTTTRRRICPHGPKPAPIRSRRCGITSHTFSRP
jgi:hypothetical protein